MAIKWLYFDVPDYEYGLPVKTSYCVNSDGVIFQNPMPKPEELATYYPPDYSHHSPSKLLAKLKDLQAKGLVEKCKMYLKKLDQILEIGVGDGRFLVALCDAEYKGFGVDKDFETWNSLFKWDVIIMHNVIEHFADPAKVIDKCYDLLTPQGKLIIRTPNTDSLSHKVFGRYWAGLQAPRHTWLFNRHNLRLLIDRKRFWITNYISLVDASSWALSVQNFLVSKGFSIPKGGIAWYSYLLIVLFYPIAWLESFVGNPSQLFVVYYKWEHEKEETKVQA